MSSWSVLSVLEPLIGCSKEAVHRGHLSLGRSSLHRGVRACVHACVPRHFASHLVRG